MTKPHGQRLRGKRACLRTVELPVPYLYGASIEGYISQTVGYKIDV